MRREGRVGGKPTNKTRVTGKCKKVGCHGCHNHPLNKSDGKSKGCVKRFAVDKHTNPHHAEFHVKPSLKTARPSLAWEDSKDLFVNDVEKWNPNSEDEDAITTPHEKRVSSISRMIDIALSNIQRTHLEEEVEMNGVELEGTDMSDDDVPDIDAFMTEFMVFKDAIEASGQASSSKRVTQSDKSWSDIELSDTEEEKWEDDWSVLDEWT